MSTTSSSSCEKRAGWISDEHKLLFHCSRGPHDAEFVGRLLKALGFKRVQNHSTIQKKYPAWDLLIPKTFPHSGDLLARVPTPVFFEGSVGGRIDTVAVRTAGGDSKLQKATTTSLKALHSSGYIIQSVGVLIDTDEKTPKKRFEDLMAEFQKSQETKSLFSASMNPSTVVPGPPRFGVLVLPDLENQGTLENLLLEDCAPLAYPRLKSAAEGYLHTARTRAIPLDPLLEELDDLYKPSGSKKALFAAMVAILKPGKSAQVSIQDNRWLSAPALKTARVRRCLEFISQLVDVPIPINV